MIGVFDSGNGGVTVLRQLATQYPQQKFVYLGDTARLPYGTKSPQTIRRYCEQNIRFLKSHAVQAVVIACNSASSQFHEESFEGLPIFNVIGPGSRSAIKQTQNQKIGILGTRATILSGAYQEQIHRLAPQIKIFAEAAPLLVPLAEEAWLQDPITTMIVERYLHNLLLEQIDTLILGCTHYPLLAQTIAQVAGPKMTLVDSGQAVCEEMRDYLQTLPPDRNQKPRIRFYTTDASSAHQKLVKTLMPQEDFDFLLAEIQSLP